MVRPVLALFAAAVIAGAAFLGDASARLFGRGGASSGGGSTTTCGTGTLCATVQNGQTFLTWTDQATGATGDTWRYQVYESASALTSGNCSSATIVGDLLANNSGQLVGGNPDSGGTTYTQANRQNAAGEMVALTFGGSALAANTGLHVRTIPSTRTTYYCLIAINNPANSGSHSPTYVGAVGPMAETAATLLPIMVRDGANRTSDPTHFYNITGSPAGMQVVFILHPSGSSGGTCSLNAQIGDVWTMYGDVTMGWQDGTPMVACLYQPHGLSPNVIFVSYRDTRWSTTFEGAMSPEAEHNSMGATPSVLTRTAYGADGNPHVYPFDARRLKHFWDFMRSHYNVGTNNWVLQGTSLGAFGVDQLSIREYPNYFAMCASSGGAPRVYSDLIPSAWPTIASADPFGANLGTNPALVTLYDGTVWGGTGGWQDLPTAVQNAGASDLCPIFISNSSNDPNWLFSGAIAFSDAYVTGKQFHAFAWNNGTHSNIESPMDAMWQQANAATGGALNHAWAYSQAWFKTDEAIPVFTSFTVDDDPNTDTVGCRNCGFQWTNNADTSSHLAFSIQNNWMARSPGTAQAGMEPTGPQHGPFTTATVDITVGRRTQSWHPAASSTVHCTNTPNGGSPSTQALTVNAQGLATFVGAIVNSSGAGTMDCVP